MSIKRPFDFSQAVKWEARYRQRGLCAHCGIDLSDEPEEFAHHVIPNQSGNSANPTHAWIRSTINCVIVCRECHAESHLDNTRTGPVALPDFFTNSHGEGWQAHEDWAKTLSTLAEKIWLELQTKARTNKV